MRRALKYTGLGLAGLLALLVVLLVWVLGTAAGSRWALGLVPGLAVEGFEGRLGGHWTAEQLRWQQGDDQVLVAGPQFDWSPSCLLRLTLCIDTLRSERIELNFAASEEPPSEEPFSLPQLSLPVSLEVGEVWLGSLQFNGTDQLQGLELAADWASEGLNISRLHVQRDELVVDLHGHVQPSGEWPLSLQGSAVLPAPGGKPWNLTLQVEGDLRQSLSLVVDSSGYLAGRLSGEVQPLAEHLPARLTLSADGFKADESLPDTLRLNGVVLRADGNLQDGYQVDGVGLLPGDGAVVALSLDGRVDAKGADIETLSLSAGPGQSLAVNGRLDWQDGFSADTHVDWENFPWLRLYPMDEAPPVTLKNLPVISLTTMAITWAICPPHSMARPAPSRCRRRSVATCSRSTCHSCRCAQGKAGSMASSPSVSPAPCVGTPNCRSAISTPLTGLPSCPGVSPGRSAARGSCLMGAWNSPATSTCKAACAASQRSCRPRLQAPVSVGM